MYKFKVDEILYSIIMNSDPEILINLSKLNQTISKLLNNKYILQQLGIKYYIIS